MPADFQRPDPTAADALTDALVRALREHGSSAAGLAGPPGSGKTTLARACASMLGDELLVLSLDDYYLPAAERERLAREVHPLFATRGVPGTHELDRLVSDLDRLAGGDVQNLRLPVFDKQRDERRPQTEWRTVQRPPRHVLLEGWCVGLPPQADDALGAPVNALEREHDPDGRWRRAVNGHLRRMHQALAPRLGFTWYLRAPGWTTIESWRLDQEDGYPDHQRMDASAVRRFLQHFERLVCHAQASCQDWADRVIALDQRHAPFEKEPVTP
ncbi:MAG: AAA family ATPase [Xanthomonadales bacterium]|nr:AAA family ATPase [Xanthomonadales bacterium]